MNVPFLQTATFTGLVSTDEYYTSQEWKEAYDNTQILYTNVASNSANWDIAYNIATFYAQNSAILIEETTFSELTSLKANNLLNPGQLYVITDFELKWRNTGFYDPDPFKSSGVIEPLIVQALSSNKLNIEAYSTLHPEDIVYYDIDATESYTWTDGGPRPGSSSPVVPGIKGWITRRVNRIQNIDIAWDWRYIKTNCCQFDISSLPLYDASTTYNRFDVVRSSNGRVYYSIEDNNLNNGFNTFWWLLLFGDVDVANVYIPTTERGETIGAPLLTLAPILSTRTLLPSLGFAALGSRNFTIKSGFNNLITTTCNNTNIGTGCNNNYITTGSFINNTIGNSFEKNIFNSRNENLIIGDNFSQNIINGVLPGFVTLALNYSTFKNSVQRNIFNNRFSYNIVGNQMSNNVFATLIENNNFGDSFINNRIGRFFKFNVTGNSFQNNAIYSNFTNNKINDTFQNNTIGTNFTYNTLGNNCTNNTIGDFCSYNNILNQFSYNTIGTFFLNNIIANEFYSNTIGNNFTFNIINNSFLGNTIESNFTKTNINNEIQNINFTGATHVYNNYDKNIFKNFDSNARLSYFNSNDQLVVTDPTA